VLKKGTGTSQQTKILDEIERSLGASPLFQQAASRSFSSAQATPFSLEARSDPMGSIVDALIPFCGGVYCLLVGFRVVGKKPGEDAKFDAWHAKFGTVLKVCGVVLFVVAGFYLIV
jgi:hypothetical protein